MVALFNTLHRTSESLAAVEQFRQIYKDTQDAEKAKKRIEKPKVSQGTPELILAKTLPHHYGHSFFSPRGVQAELQGMLGNVLADPIEGASECAEGCAENRTVDTTCLTRHARHALLTFPA